ncbi:VTT domain-containing protein [Haloactinomyces albus]|uniref:Membrane protein YqaA with SNARE-associated domain n=1 Tax=Haloactinomyces albus TaxID=1352928 RepID=A0AAE3ZBL5_9ACTN|nr:VTT domain-containing protein [Haloactinomyces albus]MDR7300134.1 membrane protein YqaA with SNARE-associated domain [Haloactinomyces albus]
MTSWLMATVGTAALGSVFPVINIELYLLGVVSTVDGVSWWALALAATVGQLAGKMLFFLAGRGSITLGRRLGNRARAERDGRWTLWLEKFHGKARERPWWGLSVLFLGAVVGLPPFTLMCLVSGATGMAWISFLGVSFAGRSLRFLLIAGAPELLQHLPAFG